MKLKRNRCKCGHCGDIIESKHRHDYVECECGRIATDGGVDYIRRASRDNTTIYDMSEYHDEEDQS